MRHIIQIFKHIQLRKKNLIPLIGCYLLFFTSAIMIAQTSAYFTSTSTIEGQIRVSHSYTEDRNKEESKDQNDEKKATKKAKQNQEKQDFKEEKEEHPSSDEEKQTGLTAEEEQDSSANPEWKQVTETGENDSNTE